MNNAMIRLSCFILIAAIALTAGASAQSRILPGQGLPVTSAANAALAYRTVATGNWDSVACWESFDGSVWGPASLSPTSADSQITVRNGHTMTVATSVAVDQVVVEAGGRIRVATGQTLTVADAADSIDLAVSGTLDNFGTVTATGRISFESGGLYIHSGGGTLPSSTWRTGSTCRVDSTSGTTPTNLNTQSLYNLVWNGSNATANGGPNFPDGTVIYGDVTVLNTKSFQWRITNLSAGQTKNISIRGNVTVNGSTALLTSTGSSADTAAKAVITIDGSVNVLAGQWSLDNSSAAYAEWRVKGNVSVTGGTLQSGTSGWAGRRTLNFCGGGAQSFAVSAPGTLGSAATTFTVSNNSNVQVNFPFTLSANSILGLVSGNFSTTAVNLITLPATGVISGGSSSAYVDGPLAVTVATTSLATKTFQIGKGAAYKPVTLAVNQDAATATAYTAEVFNTSPPPRTLPGALAAVSTVRYYHIVKGSGANVAPLTGATIQLTYDAGDSVASASLLRIAKDDGAGNWVSLGGSGTADTTGSITSNAFFSFSDFVLAKADTGSPVLLPTVGTTSVSGISTTFASSGGNVTNDGGAAVSARGVCWNSAGSPTIADNTTSDGTGAGIYTSQLTGLTPGGTYHIRAYATNSAGTGYGNEVTFSTLSMLVPPSVTTSAITNILVTTAVSGGNVTDWGGDPVTARGICWNTTGNPVVGESHTLDGSGLGSYTSGLALLTGNTTYHVRAYATNGAGTGYGNDLPFTTQSPQPDTTVFVAQDASGDYLTVQAAFNAVPANYTGKWTIFVKKGVYYEKLLLANNRINVILQGENRDSTILTYDDYADRFGPGNPGTSGSYSVAIDASDFTARDITFRNTYSPQTGVTGTQAVALRTQGDRHEYINCRMLGFQDTYYTWGGTGTGRMYHRDCFIEGTVDFIFGRNIAVFDRCTIHEIRNSATLTAGSTDPSSQYGYVFRNCTILADSLGYDGVPITSLYLGRPWQAAPRTVFINSFEPQHLNAAGWLAFNVTPALYAEFNCYGPGSATGGRVAWSSQLTGPGASNYSLSNIFAKSSASSPLILYNWMPPHAVSDLPLAMRIAASAGPHGSIAPPDTTNVAYGGSRGYTITPFAGYHIADVHVDSVSVGAVPAYNFTGVTANRAISASFAPVTQFALMVTALNGSVTKVPDQALYDSGSGVQLTAVPFAGYHFTGWTGDAPPGNVSDNPLLLLMDSSKTLQAVFVINEYTLTAGVTGTGTVTKDPDQTSYTYGTSVTLTAAAPVGWLFGGWTGDTVSAANPITLLMDRNRNVTATFTADSAYDSRYRSFAPNAIPADPDNKGKRGKYVLRKPDKSQFSLGIRCDSAGVTSLHAAFSSAIDTAFTLSTIPPSTVSTADLKLKQWDFVFGSPLQSGDSVRVSGYAWSGKGLKGVKYSWSRLTTPVGKPGKNALISNVLRLPMPNRVNVLFETYALGGFASTGGLLVGEEKSPDSAKWYGWFKAPKYGDALKSLMDKGGFHGPNTGRPFDFFNSGKPITKQQKTISPSKQNNSLLAGMIALRLNIAASAMGRTPPGFGELIYAGGSPFDGMTLREIASLADSVMMGWLKDSVDERSKEIKLHKFAGGLIFGRLDSAIGKINGAFEGDLDTISFADSLVFKGTRQLISVPFLRAHPGAVAARIIPLSAKPSDELPGAYRLYSNYPNPFNPVTTIQFDLPEPAAVTLRIYNVLGQEVAVLVEQQPFDEGSQSVEFNAAGFASGVYVYRLTATPLTDGGAEGGRGTFTGVGKMLLIK